MVLLARGRVLQAKAWANTAACSAPTREGVVREREGVNARAHARTRQAGQAGRQAGREAGSAREERGRSGIHKGPRRKTYDV